MMAKNNLNTLKNIGVAPNILLTHVSHTAPFLFSGELETLTQKNEYLAKLIYYKKNLHALKKIDLAEYFFICMCAHWATAGTFVPTDVDNQIRERLWKHPEIKKNIERMAQITMDAWTWDYEQVTNRKSYNLQTGQVMSTHEGTWLSVAIGAYNALIKNKLPGLASKISELILLEIDKEEKLLLLLQNGRDHINFLRSAALMAHNFGDLDRVIDQWKMDDDDPFKKRIYKLGHKLNDSQNSILVFSGQINKAFLSVENHRHMSMRQAKCLRRSNKFLIPLGPFMDKWGKDLGESPLLSLDEKGEIVCAFLEGFFRQDTALGYVRAYHGLVNSLPSGLNTLEKSIPYDVVEKIQTSRFGQLAKFSEADLIATYKKKLEEFLCPITGMKF